MLKTGLTAVVTGASSGLGKAVAEKLLKLNIKVYALSRTIQQTTSLKGAVRIKTDLRDPKSVEAAFDKIDISAQSIDFLINCAGRGLIAELDASEVNDIIDVLRTNLEGNIFVAQLTYKRMVQQKSGHIINVSSTSGIKARADEPIYCASKWGLRGFTESLRLSAKTHNIRVTGVYPGGMDTPFWASEGRDTSAYMSTNDIAEEIIRILATPPRIAPAEYIIDRGF